MGYRMMPILTLRASHLDLGQYIFHAQNIKIRQIIKSDTGQKL
jgi:hypothetical protein